MNRYVAAGAGLVCVIGAAAGTSVALQADPTTSAPTVATRTVDVSRTALACAGVPSKGSDSRQLVVQPGTPSRSASGPVRVTATPFSPDAQPLWTSRSAQRGTSTSVPSRVTGLSVTATGAAAPHVAATVVDRFDSSSRSGLGVLPCRAAGESAWITGASSAVGSSSMLVLANPGRATAVVDLEFFGPRGRVATVGARGIAIAGGTQRVLPLSSYAPSQEFLTVHADVTSGQLDVAALTTRKSGLSASGAAWVPASDAPARSLVVGPTGSQAEGHQLVVSNPGDRQALVKVEVIGPDGTSPPTGLTEIDVPPHRVVSRDVASIVGREAGAFRLTSDQPVTGALVADATSGARDMTVVGATAALTSEAAVPVIARTDLELALASGGPASSVQVVATDARGSVIGRRTVDVDAGTTLTWTPQGTMAARRVVSYRVEPQQGTDLHVVATYAGGDELASVPVEPGDGQVVRPGVLPGG